MNSIPEFVKTPKSPQLIEILDIVPGEGSTVAHFTLRLGGVTVRHCNLRRGRNNATYLNLPTTKNQSGHYVHLVELTDSLEAIVLQRIYQAISQEATR
jgi:hypothetical protein